MLGITDKTISQSAFLKSIHDFIFLSFLFSFVVSIAFEMHSNCNFPAIWNVRQEYFSISLSFRVPLTKFFKRNSKACERNTLNFRNENRVLNMFGWNVELDDNKWRKVFESIFKVHARYKDTFQLKERLQRCNNRECIESWGKSNS